MKIRRLRWWIAGLLLLVSVKNYIDRQMLPVMAPTIQRELGMSDRDYATATNVFLIAYTVSYLVSGRLVDKLGARVSLALFLGLWSVAGAATGLAQTVAAVIGLRFLFAAGEAGGFTASPKVVSDWFPRGERGVAISMYSVGGAVGATLAPLLTVAVAARWGWRVAFVGSGLVGLVLIGPWLTLFRDASHHPWLTAEEKTLIVGSAGGERPAGRMSEWGRWKSILSSPTIWLLMVARMMTDPVWYFFQFWMPKYLFSARHFDQRSLSALWTVFLAAAVGFVAGGFLSDLLVRRGRKPLDARLRIMTAAALVVPVGALIPFAAAPASVLAIAMIAVLAHTAWLTNHNAYVMDLLPNSIFGTAYGFISAGSAVGGILMNQAVIGLIGRYSYNGCFYAMILLHPLALAVMWVCSLRQSGALIGRFDLSST